MGILIGIDGARGGWVGCRLEGESVAFLFLRDHELGAVHDEADEAWIDMPIGLPGREGPYPRACDLALRERLGKRASSAFMCPIREAVYADSYGQACHLNAEATGKKISLQAWNICPKIRLVDQLLQTRPRALVRESHHEYNFQCLKGEPLKHAKKTPEGRDERLKEVLGRYHPALAEQTSALISEMSATRSFRRVPGLHVAQDDILDAAVLAVSAWWAAGKGCEILSGDPPSATPHLDERGLPLQIVAPRVP